MISNEIKPCQIDEIDAINRACFSKPWSKKLLEEDVKSPHSYYAVYEDNGVVVGYAGMAVIAGEANITNVATLPEMRRKGIGKAVLSNLIDICREKDFLLITLEVRRSNQSAISLYKSLGFEIEGERKKYYSDNGEDAFIMTKHFAQCTKSNE